MDFLVLYLLDPRVRLRLLMHIYMSKDNLDENNVLHRLKGFANIIGIKT